LKVKEKRHLLQGVTPVLEDALQAVASQVTEKGIAVHTRSLYLTDKAPVIVSSREPQSKPSESRVRAAEGA
jgi:hypothetical protein